MNTNFEWFSKRPAIASVCAHCRGSGMVALVPADPPIAGVPADVISAVVRGAQSIFLCVEEAHAIAKASQRSVAFEFSGSIVTVDPGTDPVTLVRDWWMSQYGEPQEESAARR